VKKIQKVQKYAPVQDEEGGVLGKSLSERGRKRQDVSGQVRSRDMALS